MKLIDIRDSSILIDGVHCYIEQAYSQLRQPVIDSGILTPHPDDIETEQADRLLLKLLDTDLLSDKAKAVIKYHSALENILQHTEKELP